MQTNAARVDKWERVLYFVTAVSYTLFAGVPDY